jgi:spore coat polysaccharide biosynthesis predicted glycosyltransferase SpsG
LRGVETAFVVSGDSGDGTNWYREDFLRGQISKEDLAVADSYTADINVYQSIFEKARGLVVIDDNNRLPYPPCLLVNPAIAARGIYQKKKGTTYLLGPKYAMVRREFLSGGSREIKKDIGKIMLTMGGAARDGVIEKIKTALGERFPVAEVTVARGLSAAEMTALMQGSDLAVTAAGQTVFEIMMTGLPFVCVKNAANQSLNIKGFIDKKVIDDYADTESGDCIEKLPRLVSNLMGVGARKKQSERMKRIMDNRSVKTVADAILRYKGARR